MCVCLLGVSTSFTVISVFVCMHCFRLCMASVCVLERLCVGLCVFHCGVSAADPVVEPASACAFDMSVLCLCIVAVVSVAVLCCACFVWFDMVQQSGIGLPKVLLHHCNTIDDPEFTSFQWRRDYLVQ